MLRVALYEPYCFELYGNARYILTLVRLCPGGDVEFRLITPDEGALFEEFTKYAPAHVVRPSATLARYGGVLSHCGIRESVSIIIALLTYWVKLFSFFRKHPCDVLQVHNVRALLLAALPAKLHGTKIVWYVKGHLENPALDTLGFLLSDRVLFQSPYNAERRYPRLRKIFGKKLRILLNGIDLTAIRRAQTEPRQLPPAPVVRVGFFGVLCRAKGVDLLVHAFARIVQQGYNAELFLVGDLCIPENQSFVESLQMEIATLGLTKLITFTGYLRDPLPLMRDLDICILPSLAEGVPKSIMEAMALGKAVVATKVGGMQTLIEDGRDGFLVDPGRVEPLYERMLQLVKDPFLRVRFGEAAGEKAVAHFDIQNHLTELKGIYQEFELVTRPCVALQDS